MIGPTILDPVICLLNPRQSLNPALTKDTLSQRTAKRRGVFLSVYRRPEWGRQKIPRYKFSSFT